MVRPTKLIPGLQQRIGENVALGLTYSLAAEAVGITYKTLNLWPKRGQTDKSEKYNQFYQYIPKCNADGAKKRLEQLNDATAAGNCQVCMWILERRFPDCFGRRVYRKMDVVSENKNENIELTINDTDGIRKKILEKFDKSLHETTLHQILP